MEVYVDLIQHFDLLIGKPGTDRIVLERNQGQKYIYQSVIFCIVNNDVKVELGFFTKFIYIDQVIYTCHGLKDFIHIFGKCIMWVWIIQEQGSLKFKSFNSGSIDICYLFECRKKRSWKWATVLNPFLQGCNFLQVSSGVSQTSLAKEWKDVVNSTLLCSPIKGRKLAGWMCVLIPLLLILAAMFSTACSFWCSR